MTDTGVKITDQYLAYKVLRNDFWSRVLRFFGRPRYYENVMITVGTTPDGEVPADLLRKANTPNR